MAAEGGAMMGVARHWQWSVPGIDVPYGVRLQTTRRVQIFRFGRVVAPGVRSSSKWSARYGAKLQTRDGAQIVCFLFVVSGAGK